MDIWSKLFRYSSLAIGVVILLVALIVLSNAQDGMLTVEGLQHLEAPLTSFYEMMLFFIYPWIALTLFIFGRFLYRTFTRR